MANHGSAAATRHRGNHSPEKANPKKEAVATPPSNVVQFPAWPIPVPALADGNALGCACDIIAIGGNIASTVLNAEFDYEKEMADLGMDMLATLESTLDDGGKAPDTPPEAIDAMIMQQTAKALEVFEACWAANLRLTRRLCDTNMAAWEAMATLPRHFLGKT